MMGKFVSNDKSEEMKLAILEHIEKFDGKDTHYGGVKKKYLDAKLNVNIMHDLFIQGNPDLKEHISVRYYLNYF